MTNQNILDQIEFSLPSVSSQLRELILDAVWQVLQDNREDEKTEGE